MENEKMITAEVASLRDPCVLLAKDGNYYMYGTCWQVYRNTTGNLKNGWEAPVDCVVVPTDSAGDHWAPEVHYYQDAYYMFTTYKSKTTGHRGCAVFKSESPMGPFTEISNGHITPKDWDAIDATLYIDEKGQPWTFFVHEWTSMPDRIGDMVAAKLSKDLTHIVSEPVKLFHATDSNWANGGITDGPWIYKTANRALLMLWSNFAGSDYCVGVVKSENGNPEGPWVHLEKPLFCKEVSGKYDGGHGMIFTDKQGQMWLSVHAPNNYDKEGKRPEKPVFLPLIEQNNNLVIGYKA